MFSEQKLPVSTPPEQIWTLRYREQCTKWAGLSTQTAISTESAHQNDLTRCAVYTQYVILRSPRIVPVTNLNEAVPRTFHSARNMNACVPRTCSENILPGFCTENIYERAHRIFCRKIYGLMYHTKLATANYDTALNCWHSTVRWRYHLTVDIHNARFISHIYAYLRRFHFQQISFGWLCAILSSHDNNKMQVWNIMTHNSWTLLPVGNVRQRKRSKRNEKRRIIEHLSIASQENYVALFMT